MKTQQAALWTFSGAYFVFGTGSLAVIGLIDPIAHDLSVGRTAIAQLVTVFAIAFAVLAPAVQMLGSRLPRRVLLAGGLAMFALGLIATALAPSYEWAVAARIVTALGAAGIGPVASALATSLVPVDEQASALATVFAGMTVATVLGVPLSAWLGHVMSWHWVFIGLGALALACAGAVLLVVSDRSAGIPVHARDLANVFERPATRWAIGATLAQMAAQFATYTLIGQYLQERTGAVPAAVSVALLAFGVGGVVGNTLVGRFADRFEPHALIKGSLIALGAVFAVLAVLPRSVPLALVTLTAWALTGNLFMVPQQKRLVALAPAQRGLLLAMNASALYVGMSLGTVVGSVVNGTAGSAWLPAASLLLLIAAAASHALSRKAHSNESSTPDVAAAAHVGT